MSAVIEKQSSSEQSLDCLPVGGVGRIRRIKDTGLPGIRLGILGFLPGQILRLAKTAPLGDPIAVDINGTRIGIRLAEARSILLEMEGGTDGQDT